MLNIKVVEMIPLPDSSTSPLKATSHSTIFDIPMRPLREDQKHRHRSTR